jgi:hypothetical protein
MPEAFHFQHPQWFWLLLPLLLLWWRMRRPRTHDNPWRRVCDAHLLPYLLIDTAGRAAGLPAWLLGCAWLLAVIALADPVWDRQPQPVFRSQEARVVVLDLSRSMLAADLPPSRLARARFKVADILDRSPDGQTGLVVFAGDAFAVAPLSNDTDTIRSLLAPLEPQLMPVQGSRVDLGLAQASDLLTQAGQVQGEILLITDGYTGEDALQAARELRAAGYRLSVLGVGTAAGAPLADRQGGYLRDAQGNIVMPQLDVAALRKLATVGGGRYVGISSTDQDLRYLLAGTSAALGTDSERTDLTTEAWRSRHCYSGGAGCWYCCCRSVWGWACRVPPWPWAGMTCGCARISRQHAPCRPVCRQRLRNWHGIPHCVALALTWPAITSRRWTLSLQPVAPMVTITRAIPWRSLDAIRRQLPPTSVPWPHNPGWRMLPITRHNSKKCCSNSNSNSRKIIRGSSRNRNSNPGTTRNSDSSQQNNSNPGTTGNRDSRQQNNSNPASSSRLHRPRRTRRLQLKRGRSSHSRSPRIPLRRNHRMLLPVKQIVTRQVPVLSRMQRSSRLAPGSSHSHPLQMNQRMHQQQAHNRLTWTARSSRLQNSGCGGFRMIPAVCCGASFSTSIASAPGLHRLLAIRHGRHAHARRENPVL